MIYKMANQKIKTLTQSFYTSVQGIPEFKI